MYHYDLKTQNKTKKNDFIFLNQVSFHKRKCGKSAKPFLGIDLSLSYCFHHVYSYSTTYFISLMWRVRWKTRHSISDWERNRLSQATHRSWKLPNTGGSSSRRSRVPFNILHDLTLPHIPTVITTSKSIYYLSSIVFFVFCHIHDCPNKLVHRH